MGKLNTRRPEFEIDRPVRVKGEGWPKEMSYFGDVKMRNGTVTLSVGFELEKDALRFYNQLLRTPIEVEGA